LRDKRGDWVYFMTPTPHNWERDRVAACVSRVPQARMLTEGAMVVLPAMGSRRNRWLNYSTRPSETWSVLGALRVADRAIRERTTLRAAAASEDLRAFVWAMHALR
jgi:hypothetical protein